MTNDSHEDPSEPWSDRMTDGTISEPGDSIDTAGAQLLLVVESGGNRDQLATWLSQYHAVEILGEDPIPDALGRCDLCLVDGASFATIRDELASGKATAQPVYLPYLLVLTNASLSELGSDEWDAVDDVIETPIRQSELRGRIESLLRARRYSVALKKQNDRLEQFADIVAHDLRNPLTIAKGFLEPAREEGVPDHFDRIDNALDRMDAIITDVLTLARTGTAITETEPVDPTDVAETAWRTVATMDATLTVEREGQMDVQADESRLVELFENLFRNAVEYADESAQIRVGYLDDETGFFVADDGQGIPTAKRTAVFEYGYTTAKDGTGFGLAIVKNIVDAHDWSIRITDALTGGARFEVVCEPMHTPADSTDHEKNNE